MTLPDVAAPPDEPDAPEPPAGHQGRRTLALVASSVLTVTVVAAAGWWATHPAALDPAGMTTAVSVVTGESTVIAMSVQPSSGEVRLIDAQPVITTNGAEAEVRVLLCGNPAHLRGHTVVHTARGSAEQVCSTTDQPRDARLARVSPDDPYLVIEVTPRRPGTVVVEGLRVRYRTGLQRGEQLTGQTVTAHAAAGE